MYRSPPSSPPFPYTTLFRSRAPPTGRSRSGASTSTTRLHTPIPPRLTRPPRLHRPPLNRERRAGPGRAARKCAGQVARQEGPRAEGGLGESRAQEARAAPGRKAKEESDQPQEGVVPLGDSVHL